MLAEYVFLLLMHMISIKESTYKFSAFSIHRRMLDLSSSQEMDSVSVSSLFSDPNVIVFSLSLSVKAPLQ